MKILVLNVDRDDDFGLKAKVKSPIVGIRDNIDAANKLGQEDPEDSDLNSIFYAISIYNTTITNLVHLHTFFFHLRWKNKHFSYP